VRDPGLGKHPPDRAVVDAELGGNRADAPFLGMVQPQDLRFVSVITSFPPV
jgi:hypothetical protein